MTSYNLGAHQYKSKAEITKQAKHILKHTKAGTKLTDEAEAFVRALLMLHPRLAHTQAVERDLYVTCSKRGDKCFGYWSNRKGAAIDFSWKECISPKPPIDRFAHACRESVADDIIVFKRAFWAGKSSVKCPVSGERMYRSNSHVDHAEPTFAALVDQFISEQQIDLSTVTYRGNHFAQEALSRKFREYHRQHATLAVISAFANLSKGSSGYKRAKGA